MKKNILSISSIIECREIGKRCKLHAIKSYWFTSPYELQKECNGVGPEWLPRNVVKRLTNYFDYFLPSTNIHDWEAKELPNTDEAFNEWNERLHDNIKQQYVHDYKQDKEDKSWFNPKRAIAKLRRYRRAKACDFLYINCALFGRGAFEDSHDE
ncbi:MAG: hypothetical protein ACTSQB_05270 [Candidatus Heimdallarchaeota archaeon]